MAVIATAAGSALAAALLALIGFALILRRSRHLAEPEIRADPSQAVFLFDGEILIDATDSARRLLRARPTGKNDWERVIGFLAESIPSLGDGADLESLGPSEGLIRSSETGLCRVSAIRYGTTLRIEVSGDLPDLDGEAGADSGAGQRDAELALLREIAGKAPVPMWIADSAGSITWANAAYLGTAAAVAGMDMRDLSWPPPALFSDLKSMPKDRKGRITLKLPGGSLRYFNVTSVGSDSGGTGFAIPADEAAKADATLRDFVQTLSKTFAHLPTGIAIFDSNKRLILFNPALVDLFPLPAEHLASRPTLADFFDRLRECRMVPEPRNYSQWRQSMIDLQSSARNGTYDETWALGTGQTFRVVGRPHPGGAIAFLFQDISAEMSVTRRFRAELQLEQEVLDNLGFAVAVFSASGNLSLCSRSYAELWGTDPAANPANETLHGSIRRWSAGARRPGFIARAEAAVSGGTDASAFTEDLATGQGRLVTLSFRRLTGGAVMASFRDLPEVGGRRRFVLRQPGRGERTQSPAPLALEPETGR